MEVARQHKMPRQKREPLVQKFKRKAFVIRSMEDLEDRSASGYELRRVFNATDLVILGVGCTVGAGIMVLTGVAARETAGPGVVLSYSIAGFAALLASLCYAEFAADIPVAGGAFNFVGMTYGEFFAWVAACDLILEYTLSAAAIAKGFTAYMASLCGADLEKIRLQVGAVMLDFPAFGAVVVLSLVLMRSTRESAVLNVIMVVLHMVLILFVMCAGFPFSDTANYDPFLPYGVRGVFAGAAVVFFSFIGFDTVATAAEEAIDPGRSLPIGIVGSLGITTVLYVLMCLVITGMQHYDTIDKDAPFSVAFEKVGLSWAGKVVSIGALVGIVTALLGSLLGQARIYITLGRQHLLSPWLARVNGKTGTPINATIITMFTAGILALLFDIEQLSTMVSIGTLVVFTMVCSGVLFRRYCVRGEGESVLPLVWRLAALAAFSLAASITYTAKAHFAAPVSLLGCWVLTTASFYLLPVRYMPSLFRCPFFPWVPSLGILCCLHLIGSLGWPAYVRWVVWFLIGTTVYLCYGIHNSQHEGKARKPHNAFNRSVDEGFDAALALGLDDFDEEGGSVRGGKGTELSRLRPHEPPSDSSAYHQPANCGHAAVKNDGGFGGGGAGASPGVMRGGYEGLSTADGLREEQQGLRWVNGGVVQNEVRLSPETMEGHQEGTHLQGTGQLYPQQQQQQVRPLPKVLPGTGRPVGSAPGTPAASASAAHSLYHIEAEGGAQQPGMGQPPASTLAQQAHGVVAGQGAHALSGLGAGLGGMGAGLGHRPGSAHYVGQGAAHVGVHAPVHVREHRLSGSRSHGDLPSLPSESVGASQPAWQQEQQAERAQGVQAGAAPQQVQQEHSDRERLLGGHVRSAQQ